MSHTFIRPGRAATLAVLLSALACHNPARGQGTTTTLLVEVQNVVDYQVDTYDLSKFGTNPNVTNGDLMAGLGALVVSVGDIVAVNGDPAKGTYISQAAAAAVRPNPPPGQPIADTSWTTSLSIRRGTSGPSIPPVFSTMQVHNTPLQPFSTGFRGGIPTSFVSVNRSSDFPLDGVRHGRRRLQDLDRERGQPSRTGQKASRRRR